MESHTNINTVKSLFVTLGLFVLIGLAAVVWFVVHFVRAAGELDASSKAYVDAAVSAIAKEWSPNELYKRSAPELNAVASRKDIEQLFLKLSELGALKDYQGAKGDSNLVYTTKEGKRITAHYKAHAVFASDDADFDVALIQHDGVWQILGFHVNSPIFLKKSEDSAPKKTHGTTSEKKPEQAGVKE